MTGSGALAARNEAARGWVRDGTALFLSQLDTLSDDDLTSPCLLPGWVRTHLVGHVGLNADALRNLAAWARTGVETPMYSSAHQRGADIERAGDWPPEQVRELAIAAARRLADDLDALTDEQWRATIRTAQGRTVPFSEVPWMRAREVMVHSVDLGTGVTFADLPEAFSVALIEDIAIKRSAGPEPVSVEATAAGWVATVSTTAGGSVRVSGRSADLAAWLAGRTDGAGLSTDGPALPALGPWL